MRKLLAIFILLFSISSVFSQTVGIAGPDKTVSDKPTKIGPPDDGKSCYHWEATPPDPSLTETSSAQPTVFPKEKTVYKLTMIETEFSKVTVDEVTVFKFGIEYFRHSAGKEWKVVVGEPIEYSAFADANCTDWEWDMEDGFPDTWNPTGGNAQKGTSMVIPYSDLSSTGNSIRGNDMFGENYGTVKVKCKDADGKVHEVLSTNMATPKKAMVFFEPNKNVDGDPPSNSKPPCWFIYWKDGVVPGLDDFEYDNSLDYGASNVVGGTHYLWVGPSASGTHYSNLIINGVQYAGAKGIDCCAEVVRHEKRHNELKVELIAGQPDTDPATAIDNFLGDLLPDNREPPLGCSITNKDTYNLALIKSPIYSAYGDNEYAAIVAAYGQTGVSSKDWSKRGKQW